MDQRAPRPAPGYLKLAILVLLVTRSKLLYGRVLENGEDVDSAFGAGLINGAEEKNIKPTHLRDQCALAPLWASDNLNLPSQRDCYIACLCNKASLHSSVTWLEYVPAVSQRSSHSTARQDITQS